jgi:hypothetical protein
VGTNGPGLREEGNETVFTTRCRHLKATTRTELAYVNVKRRDGSGGRMAYDRASGCLYFESVCSQHMVPELYVVRTVGHPS